MKYNPEKHHRRSIRLHGYDYSQPGTCFITICTHQRQCLFGEINDGKMFSNEMGEMAKQCWSEIPQHFPHASLDVYVIMPNHVHGIIIINNTNVGAIVVGARHAVPLQQLTTGQFGKPTHGSIPTIIRSFKSAVTKRINEYRNIPGNPVWQRNYYDHIIRDDNEMNRIRQYIIVNPMNWKTDENFCD